MIGFGIRLMEQMVELMKASNKAYEECSNLTNEEYAKMFPTGITPEMKGIKEMKADVIKEAFKEKDKEKDEELSVLEKEIWNSAIEAAALIAEGIAEDIRKLKK